MSVVWAVEAVDELVGEDGSVVLLAVGGGHRVVRLSPLGHAVRELTTGGIPSELLIEALIKRFGTPPGRSDANEDVWAAIGSLESEGVVCLTG